MAFTIRKKTPCSKCNKAAGVFTCRGCEKDFCYRHVAEHRQELNKKMDEVATNHDQLQQTIAEQEAQPNCHPLMKKIDEWEQESINKIRQTATNTRKELLTIVGTHRNKVTKDLTFISKELNRARDEDDYVETDLKEWINRIEKLKKDLFANQIIDFGQDNNSNTLISKIFVRSVSMDSFDRTTGDIQILENGRIALHGQMLQNAAVRGREEYSSGKHRLRFKIEQWNGNGDFYCGIVSTNMSMDSLLYIINSSNHYQHELYYNKAGTITAHNNNNLFYFISRNYNNQKDDILELFIDCDQRIIRLTNERTRNAQQLNVSTIVCSFPWQFFITLLYANDRIRLCEQNPSNDN